MKLNDYTEYIPSSPPPELPAAGVLITSDNLGSVILRLTDQNTDNFTGAAGFVHPQYSTRCSATSLPDPTKPGFYRIMVSYSYYIEVNISNPSSPQLLTPQSIAFPFPSNVGECTSSYW